jgi:ABC-type glycerol-3-phosphate transport system substrate-binding protein
VADEDSSAWLLGDEQYLAQSAEGLQFLSDLIWEHKVAPPPSVTRDAGGNALFKNGRVAMCTYGRWACMEFKEIDTFDWDSVELPRHREQATTVFGVCYAIGARTQLPEESWTLLKFLTNKRSQAEVAHSGQAIPSRQSVAESDAFLQPRAFGEREVDSRPHFTQVPFARFGPRFPTAAQTKTKLIEALEPLWNQPPENRPSALEILREAQPSLAAVARGELGGQAQARPGNDDDPAGPQAPPSRVWVLSLFALCGLGGVSLKVVRGRG